MPNHAGRPLGPETGDQQHPTRSPAVVAHESLAVASALIHDLLDYLDDRDDNDAAPHPPLSAPRGKDGGVSIHLE